MGKTYYPSDIFLDRDYPLKIGIINKGKTSRIYAVRSFCNQLMVEEINNILVRPNETSERLLYMRSYWEGKQKWIFKLYESDNEINQLYISVNCER